MTRIDARSDLDLARLDSRPIPEGSGELRLFATVRNESLRLPRFLQYYAEAGVDRFFLIDNGSTDGTLDLLLEHPSVHVFEARGSYAGSGYGTLWVQLLMSEYGLDRWCLAVDADEMLVYPGVDIVRIPELCQFLDAERATGLYSTLIDMYADSPLSSVYYRSWEDPLAVCPYFEVDSIVWRGHRSARYGAAPIANGGMRQRVFGLDVSLDKISLFKFRPPMVLYEGMHRLSHVQLSELRGAVLHFKYLRDFEERARVEAGRGEHWSNGLEYKQYAATLDRHPTLNPCTASSRRYGSWVDLADCGVLRSTPAFDEVLRLKGYKG